MMPRMPEGVIYRHSVEALVQRVLLRRGLLSLELDRELKALGVDASRPAEVKLDAWIQVLRVVARRLSPQLDEAAALEALGREQFIGYAEGLVGKALVMVLRLIGPRRTLLRMKENYETADNVTRVTTRELGPSSMELEFNSDFGVPTFIQGVVSEALGLLRARDAKVSFRKLDTGATVFSVSWAE